MVALAMMIVVIIVMMLWSLLMILIMIMRILGPRSLFERTGPKKMTC